MRRVNVVAKITDYNTASEESKLEMIKTFGSIQYLEDIAEEAFQNKGGAIWKELQVLLFDTN
ncbi:MAG: hypothetical protein ACI9FJ_002894, partial [Alteromonadaceae bacterium]